MQPSERVISNPNLPEHNVTTVAVGARYKETIGALNRIGIKTIEIPDNDNLNSCLSGHADLNLFHFPKNKLFFDFDNIAGDLKENFQLVRIKGDSRKEYPEDCLINCLTVGKYLICNPDVTDRQILIDAEKNELTVIPVNQGYAKCSVCPLTDSAIITDDISISRSAEKFSIDVLLISKGSIRLEGMNYGFIGGATGKTGKNKLAVNGRLDSHPDCNKIIDFLYKYNITLVELINDVITDIGSIIPLLEESR